MKTKIRKIIFVGLTILTPSVMTVACTAIQSPTFVNLQLISNVKNDVTIKVDIKNLPQNIKTNDVTMSISEKDATSVFASVSATKIEGQYITFKFNNLKSGTSYKILKITIKNKTVLNVVNQDFTVKDEQPKESVKTESIKPLNSSRHVVSIEPVDPTQLNSSKTKETLPSKSAQPISAMPTTVVPSTPKPVKIVPIQPKPTEQPKLPISPVTKPITSTAKPVSVLPVSSKPKVITAEKPKVEEHPKPQILPSTKPKKSSPVQPKTVVLPKKSSQPIKPVPAKHETVTPVIKPKIETHPKLPVSVPIKPAKPKTILPVSSKPKVISVAKPKSKATVLPPVKPAITKPATSKHETTILVKPKTPKIVIPKKTTEVKPAPEKPKKSSPVQPKTVVLPKKSSQPIKPIPAKHETVTPVIKPKIETHPKLPVSASIKPAKPKTILPVSSKPKVISAAKAKVQKHPKATVLPPVKPTIVKTKKSVTAKPKPIIQPKKPVLPSTKPAQPKILLPKPKKVSSVPKPKISVPLTPKKTTVELKDPKGIYQVYDKFADLINPNLNFINKNFKADKLADGKYRKNYRLQQLFRNSIWKFDKKANTYSWSVDEQWITNMMLRDEGNVSNINLYLYIENLNPKNASDLLHTTRPIFRDYLESLNDEGINRYYDSNVEYPLGIRFDWLKLKAQGHVRISTPKYFDLDVRYDATQKTIYFKILAKPGVTFTDEPYIAQQGKDVFVSSPDNFLSISFETNNNENKTIEKFKNPSKAAEGVNVNAFDLSTVVPNKDIEPITTKENRYLLAGKVIDDSDNNSFVDEMAARTFSDDWGTWTMWGKVKPSDPSDQRYYIFTNQHVRPEVADNFDPNKASLFHLYKQVGDYNFPDTDEPKITIKVMPFWGFTSYKDRWTNKIYPNTVFDHPDRDMQVSIIDLKDVFKQIDGYWAKNKDYVNGTTTEQTLKTLRHYFERWSTFKPLQFTDDYKLINSDTVYLDDWIVTSHAGGLAQTYFAKFRDGNINKPEFYGETYVGKDTTRTYQLLVKGASGSLIVRGDRKLIGINNQLGGGSNFAQFFYTSQLDSIGSNVDGSNPADNNNPSTFAKAVIEAHKEYPNKYDLLDMFK